MNKSLILLVCFFLGLSVSAHAQVVAYRITDLGTLGGPSSEAFAINSGGLIVGVAETSGSVSSLHGFLSNGSSISDFGTLGGTWSETYDINNMGQSVGFSTLLGDSNYHAVLRNGSSLIDLQTLGGSSSAANAINASGKIVGYSFLAGDASAHAFSYYDSAMHDLGTLGGAKSEALDINDDGIIVGRSFQSGSTYWRAFRYSGSSMSDLGTLGGSTSAANAVNNQGDIVGLSKIAGDAADHAFLYSNSSMVDLGVLSGTTDSEALAINNLGHIVGYAHSGDNYSAFVSFGSGLINLNSMIPASSGWSLSNANDVNDAGQIVGSGVAGGLTHAYRLDPVVHSCWESSSGGSWGFANSWNIGLVPKRLEDEAVFADAIGSDAASITLDGDRNLGKLTFYNSVGGKYSILPGATNPSSKLYLAGGGPSALVETLTGVAEIASPIVLRNNASFDVAAEAELTISGPITELGSPKWLEKTGEGTLVLANSVAYGDMTFIDGGTLVFAGGIASGGTNFLSVRAGKAELTTTNINKASLLVYTSFGAEFEISGGNHSIGGIFGIGTTKVLAGTLYARSIVQDTLIIGTDEDASAANAVSVPEPNGLPLMIFAALALALRTILVRAKN